MVPACCGPALPAVKLKKLNRISVRRTARRRSNWSPHSRATPSRCAARWMMVWMRPTRRHQLCQSVAEATERAIHNASYHHRPRYRQTRFSSAWRRRCGQSHHRRKLRRSELKAFFEKLPSCLAGMEACGTVHYWGREQAPQRSAMMFVTPAACVKPYVKRGKNDEVDAEEICEAVTRPTTRFVRSRALNSNRS